MRELKSLIAAYRQMQDELAATQEQVESVTNEMAGLNALYDESKAKEQRLQRALEQMQLARWETEEANGRLCNELSLVSGTRSALYQQLSDTERDLAAARREVSVMRRRLEKWDDAQARADLCSIDEHCHRRIVESRQLGERIEVQKAELAAIEAKLREGNTALEARSRVDAQRSALWVDFGEFAQLYRSAQLLCSTEGISGRYKAIFDALADAAGKFHMGIVAESKGRFNIRMRRGRRRAGKARHS
ncbi:hypothetical protein [Paraburkholderia dokdonensis]|uniref:hypothetical protein n=1 Tax=Paraburkholderia dokdonensis TaxID=2211211 RepID=UPI00101A8C23|nr:hypothetical protein [Paraburkholderia dokdonensis]